MKRPTIADLAKTAGVSISTVNRLLHGRGSVRPETVERILDTAEEIGFYGLGALRQRKKDNLPQCKLGFLMQQSHRPIYQVWAEGVASAARANRHYDAQPQVNFVDDLSPDTVASKLLEMGDQFDAIAIVTADHPMISQAIVELREKGVPVVAFITELSAKSLAGFVGTDNWKIGRTAAWFLSQFSCGPGNIATMIGSHRYQCQDISDASFRSYLRENAPDCRVGESMLTHEEPENAYQVMTQMIQNDPGLKGVFVNGGGISGVLRAVRELPEDRRNNFKVVCRDIGPEIRKGLTEGLISAALVHPVDSISEELIRVMINAIENKKSQMVEQRLVPFEIVTPESMWG